MRGFLVFFSVLITNLAFSQKGVITGKAINSKTGEPLIGANITITPTNKSVQTDLNGKFSFSSLSPGTYSLSGSFVSFTEIKIPDISVKANDVVNQDLVMNPAGQLSNVTIKASTLPSKPKETISSLLLAQKNAPNVSDGISAESIKRTPDRNTGEILKRISGASLQEDRFAIVRGLNERYNAAYLNGSPLPSSESDRKAFAFDIFPANLIDNLVIYKTATPDMPAEFAGGQIVINTKGIPAENFQTITLGSGYNSITTFQNRKFYNCSGFRTNWEFLGIDNSRRLPLGFPDTKTFKTLSIEDRNFFAQYYRQNNWGYLEKMTLPNSSMQYVFGRNFQKSGKDFLGILFAVTHTRNYNRNVGERIFYAPEYQNQAQRVYKEETNSSQTLFGIIGNISLKINNNNTLSLKNLFSINSDDRVILRRGQDDVINESSRYTKSHALWFTSNKILTSQLIGEHYLPTTKIRINWVASIATIRRDVPALRRMTYDSTDGYPGWTAKLYDTNPVDNDNTAGLAFYSTNQENTQNLKLDLSRLFKHSDQFQSLFKVGGYYQKRNRDFNPRMLAFCNFNSSRFDLDLLQLSPDKIFIGTKGYLEDGKTGFTMKDITEIRDIYSAGTELISYYAMADQRFFKKWRLIYGLRWEDFHQTLDAEYNQFTPVNINTKKSDLLPSMNLVYSLDNRQNIRLCYSKTLNRPEFRELAPFLFRDYTIRYSVFGDTSLRRASIENFDVRYEFYPGKAQLLSVSAFYKKFTDPIELLSVSNQERTLSYRNTPSASLAGVELETRILIGELFSVSKSSLLDNLTFFTNLTLIRSKVDLQVTDSFNYYYKKGRVMQGQSPYMINMGITYVDDERSFSSTISLNRFGQRIFLASNGDALQDGTLIEPNLWENGRTQLDFQITKSFPQKRIDLKLNVKDILAQKQVFFEDTNGNQRFDKAADALRSSTTFGRVVSFVFSYKF